MLFFTRDYIFGFYPNAHHQRSAPHIVNRGVHRHQLPNRNGLPKIHTIYGYSDHVGTRVFSSTGVSYLVHEGE